MTPLEQRPAWLSGAILTFLDKLVFPIVWCSAIAGIVLGTVARTGHLRIATGFEFISAFKVVATVLLLWLCVGFQGRELPFRQIDSVEPVWWYKGRMVRIRFREATPFGTVVYYLLRWGPLRTFLSRPERNSGRSSATRTEARLKPAGPGVL